MQAELRDIFRARTTAEWIAFGDEHDTPIAPVNTPQTLADDPQFQDRLPWYPREVLGAEQLPSPIKVLDEELPVPTKAPTVGQHTDEVLTGVLGYDGARVAALREAGALG
jgi:crotonobetainyl-CoA:carnitine CoA-transferase CaiB-like acyl-CoA transferase